jgi:hypothetical protein
MRLQLACPVAHWAKKILFPVTSVEKEVNRLKTSVNFSISLNYEGQPPKLSALNC